MFHDSRELWLPLVAILNELLLVVEQLFVEESRVFVVWPLDDGVDWACLLTKATEDALRHIDVVFCGAAGAIWSWLRLDRDGVSWASRLAQFASDATLLTSWVSAQSMLSSEHGTERSLLPRVVDDVLQSKRSQHQSIKHSKFFNLHQARKLPILPRREVARLTQS